MTTFRASNGALVDITANGAIVLHAPEESGLIARFADRGWEIAALREYFEHERDEQLGRWRWPENPDYVVYPRGDGAVAVLYERHAEGGILYRRGDPVHDMEGEAARAYFDAHPEPKPWHDAKPGEVWALSVEGEEIACIVTPCGPDFEPVAHPVWATLARGSDRITSGRRIWPEATS